MIQVQNTVILDMSIPKKCPFLSDLESSMTTGHLQFLAHPPKEEGRQRDFYLTQCTLFLRPLMSKALRKRFAKKFKKRNKHPVLFHLY